MKNLKSQIGPQTRASQRAYSAETAASAAKAGNGSLLCEALRKAESQSSMTHPQGVPLGQITRKEFLQKEFEKKSAQSVKSVDSFRRGFTLVELLTVITIIALIVAVTLPSISRLFTAGADRQAYNLLAALCRAARAQAITQNTYAGVHVQMADRADLAGKCYMAVVRYNGTTFDLADGFEPVAVPGTFAFGELRNDGPGASTFTDFIDNAGQYMNITAGTYLSDFTTFTIVFNPAGEVVVNVNGGNVNLAPGNLFKSSAILDTDIQLWETPTTPEPGVSAVTMFDYKILRSLPDNGANSKANYLNENGQFMCLNLYTGQFFYRYGAE